MEASIRLGRIRGIELGLHYSWFIILVVFSAILATEQYPDLYEGWSDAQYWTVGVASVLLLFVSVVLHELGHAVTAQAKGIPVLSIVLFLFGGVATISRESETPGDEFQIAIAGPITSVLLGGLFGLGWVATHDGNEQVNALLGYLAYINLSLAVFNLIPGFPLDGGRVLRAAVWKLTDNLRRATRIATTIGTLVGTLFFFLGVISILDGMLINGLWLIALGWFLQNAAEQNYRAVAQREMLTGITVADLMDPEPVTTTPNLTIEDLVLREFLGRNVRGAPVLDGDRLSGIVTLTDIKEVDRDRWPLTLVRDVMTPNERLHTVAPSTPLNAALQVFSEHDLNQIPVVANGHFAGLLTRSDVMRYLYLRHELGLEDVADRMRRMTRTMDHAS